MWYWLLCFLSPTFSPLSGRLLVWDLHVPEWSFGLDDIGVALFKQSNSSCCSHKSMEPNRKEGIILCLPSRGRNSIGRKKRGLWNRRLFRTQTHFSPAYIQFSILLVVHTYLEMKWNIWFSREGGEKSYVTSFSLSFFGENDYYCEMLLWSQMYFDSLWTFQLKNLSLESIVLLSLSYLDEIHEDELSRFITILFLKNFVVQF